MTEMGTVTFFDGRDERRFGFILADRDNARVFFHLNNKRDVHDQERVPKKGDRVEFERGKGQKGPRAEEWAFDPFIPFGDICHGQLGMTTQEGAMFVGGFLEQYPDLSYNLYLRGDRAMYHNLAIHTWDVRTFVRRVKEWRDAKLAARKPLLAYINKVEGEYFWSKTWNQPNIPEGFAPQSFRLPIILGPSALVPDGFITTREELVMTRFPYMRWIPNPAPEHQPDLP